MFAAAKNVDNLIAIVDYNGKQIDGPLDEVISLGDFAAKWKAFGWDLLEMDGNNMDSILSVIKEAKNKTGKQKPVVILMKTTMGHGVDFMAGTHKWHGVPPNDEQAIDALKQLEETLGDF
jgi:transketolase